MARGGRSAKTAGPVRRGPGDARAHPGAGRGLVAGGIGEGAARERLPPGSGAADADPEEAAGETPPAGHTVYPGQSDADSSDAGAEADL